MGQPSFSRFGKLHLLLIHSSTILKETLQKDVLFFYENISCLTMLMHLYVVLYDLADEIFDFASMIERKKMQRSIGMESRPLVFQKSKIR